MTAYLAPYCAYAEPGMPCPVPDHPEGCTEMSLCGEAATVEGGWPLPNGGLVRVLVCGRHAVVMEGLLESYAYGAADA